MSLATGGKKKSFMLIMCIRSADLVYGYSYNLLVLSLVSPYLPIQSPAGHGTAISASLAAIEFRLLGSAIRWIALFARQPRSPDRFEDFLRGFLADLYLFLRGWAYLNPQRRLVTAVISLDGFETHVCSCANQVTRGLRNLRKAKY